MVRGKRRKAGGKKKEKRKPNERKQAHFQSGSCEQKNTSSHECEGSVWCVCVEDKKNIGKKYV